jgi:hypothetical protein
MADDAAELEEMRREREKEARQMSYTFQRYKAKDMLIARKPNEAGFYGSVPYDGGPFDKKRYRLVRTGWDHDHCYVCSATVEPGDEWWTAEPTHGVGLCLDCHGRLFGPMLR